MYTKIRLTTSYIENLILNKSIAYIRDITNTFFLVDSNSYKLEKKVIEIILKLLHPFIPYVTQELWYIFKNKEFIFNTKWPILKNIIWYRMVIQINTKIRIFFNLSLKINIIKLLKILQNIFTVNKYIRKKINKVIYINNKLLNLIIKL